MNPPDSGLFASPMPLVGNHFFKSLYPLPLPFPSAQLFSNSGINSNNNNNNNNSSSNGAKNGSGAASHRFSIDSILNTESAGTQQQARRAVDQPHPMVCPTQLPPPTFLAPPTFPPCSTFPIQPRPGLFDGSCFSGAALGPDYRQGKLIVFVIDG